MKKIKQYIKKEEGIVALGITIIVMFIGTTIVLSLVFVFLNRLEAARNIGLSEQAYFAAESGIEDALLRIMDSGKSLPASMPYTFSINSATATVTVNDLLGNSKEIISDGDSRNRLRRLYLFLTLNADSASFIHGAQVGDGGLTMANGSSVEGSVFSNGNIQGTNRSDITGDAFTAGASFIDDITVGANAYAGSITNSDVVSEARADILNTCTVGTDAYYDTSITSCTVGGTTTQETYTPLDPEPMPIPDSKIEEWKQQAVEGGIISTCSSGSYKPADQEVIGPIKIECDLVIDGNKEVFVGGYVWVRGSVSIIQNSTIRIISSMGPFSSAVIADHPGNPGGQGTVTVGNNATIEGSGDPASYLMMVSMNNNAEGGGGGTAISIQNGSSSSIFYAPHGKIDLRNNVFLVEVTGYQLDLANSARIQYQQGLDDLKFSSGPSAGYAITSWEEQ